MNIKSTRKSLVSMRSPLFAVVLSLVLFSLSRVSALTTYREVLTKGHDDFGVFWVGVRARHSSVDEPTLAYFGDRVEVHIKDLYKWYSACKLNRLIADETSFEEFTNNLFLILDSVPFSDLKPEQITTIIPHYPYHWIDFDPVRDKTKYEEWWKRVEPWYSTEFKSIGVVPKDFDGAYVKTRNELQESAKTTIKTPSPKIKTLYTPF